MANEVYNAFKAAWSYGPTSNPDNPDKGMIHGAGQVVDDQIAAVQADVDGVASFASSGANWVSPVALATTGNITLSGEQTIDGTLTSSSRVLVKNQSTGSQNGVYTTGAGAWTRATDADTAAEMLGLAVSVNGGTVNGSKSFICKAIAPITIGTTALPFVEMLNQSAFTASIAAVSTDVSRTNTKYDSLLRPTSQVQLIGAAAPAAGVDSQATTYALNKVSDFDGVITSFKIFANAATTITVGSFSRSASDVFTLQDSQMISVVPGLQTVSVRLRIDKGWYPGFTTTVAGGVQHVVTSNAGFFAGTLVGGAFTDAAVSATNELQVSFTVEQLAPESAALFNFGNTLQQVVGISADPITGANSAPGTILIGPPAESDAVIDRIRWYTAGAVTGIVGIYKKVGSAATRVKTLGRLTTVPGMNTLYSAEILEKGQYLGFQSAANGFLVYTAASAESHYYYDASATSGDSATVAALLTNATWQISADLTRIAGERHDLSLANVDRVLVIGPSYAGGYYNIVGKNWPSKVSLFSDFNFEGYSYGGNSIAGLLAKLRSDIITGYAPVHPKQMGLTLGLIMEGENSANHSSSSIKVSFTDYQEDIRQIVETMKSLGVVPVLCSEWKPVYDASAHAVYKALAEELGVYFLDMIPHTLRNFSGTVNGEFTQLPTTTQHVGTRSNAIIADRVEQFMKSFGRPANSIKLYRKRASVAVTDINNDLMFRNDYERASLFKEFLANQTSLSPETEKYYDELTSSFGTYDQNYVTKSEYLNLQYGDGVAAGEYVLLDVILNATQKNVDRFRMKIPDGIDVYIKDALQSPYGADGKSVCLWTQLTGDEGVFSLIHNQLPGKMHFDKLTFLLYKSGGMTLAEPKITWWGEEGKPAYPVLARPAATGAELLNVTKFATISGNKATGWAGVDGAGAPITITPSNDATYQLPYDITHFITADPTKKVVQTLNYTVDNFDDIEVEIRVTARYFPAIFASSGTYPSGAPINQDSFDWRKVVVDLIDPTGTFVFTQSAKIGLWWNEVVFRAILPMRVNPLDIRVSSSDEIQLAKVSVKRV